MVAQARAALGPTYAVLPGMVERRGGSIVFVSDSFARHAVVGTIAHGLVKAPMESAMKHLALELGPVGVRVNTVIPGATRSDNLATATSDQLGGTLAAVVEKTPLRRIGEPTDVARTVAALAGDEMSYVTGAFIPVSGGYLII